MALLAPVARRPRGFTLVELLVVTVVLGLLAGVSVLAIQAVRIQAATVAMQGALTRISETQVLVQERTGRFGESSAALGLSSDSLGNDITLLGIAVRSNDYAVVVRHPLGGACALRAGTVGRRRVSGGISCDRRFDLPFTLNVAGATITVDATLAYPVGLLAQALFGPAPLAAAPEDEVDWVFWSFGPREVQFGRPTVSTTASHTYATDGVERGVELFVLYRNGRLRTGRTVISATGAGGNNQPPLAQFRLPEGPLLVGQTLAPTAASSRDPDGQIVSYSWTYGSTPPPTTGVVGSVTYLLPGTFAMTLTVVDNLGAAHSSTQWVTIGGTAQMNIPPVAQFTGSPNPVTVGAPAILDARSSRDADGRLLTFDWVITGVGPAQTLSGPVVTTSFAGAGIASVQLTVTDDQGATSVRTQSLRVLSPNLAPVATVLPGTQSVRVGLPVTLSTSTATDPEGGALTTAWDFGDGTRGAGAVVSHRYRKPGTYLVTATLRDAEGATTAVTANVVAVPNIAPTASGILLTPAQPVPGVPATLQVIAPGDADGTIVQSRWLFGDGGYRLGDSVSYTFTTPGMQYISVTLRDDFGAETTLRDSVQVGAAPTAVFGVAPLPAILTEAVSFDASASSVPSGSIGAYVWIFGDGTRDSVLSPLTTHTYTVMLPGRAAVAQLIVWNGDFTMADTASLAIPLNRRPTANITPTTRVVGFGTAVAFDANASDADADPLIYSWLFGGDGTSAAPTPTHTFSGPGAYVVTLAVADSLGTTATGIASSTITVATQPLLSFTATPDSGYPTMPITLTATPTVDVGNGATVARYLWALGDGRVDSTVSGSRSIAYAVPGTYVISVRVRDSFGGLSALRADTVVIVTKPTASFTVAPDTLQLSILPFTMTSTTVGPAGYSLRWSLDGVSGPGDTLSVFTRTPATPGVYTVRLIASYGAAADTAVARLTARNRAPTASFLLAPVGVDSTVPMSAVVTATATATDPDGGALDYHWYINGVPQAGARGRLLQWSPGRPDTLTVSLWVFDRQGDSTYGGQRTIFVTDIPLGNGLVAPLPTGIVAPGSIAGFLATHNLRPSRTHTYAWTVISYAGAAPDTTTQFGPSPYMPVTMGAGDSVVGRVVITDDLGEILTPPPGLLRARQMPTSSGFACTPDDLSSVAVTSTCQFAAPVVGETADSFVAQGSPTVLSSGPMSRQYQWSAPGEYAVRVYYRGAATPGGLASGALMSSATVQVRSKGLSGVDFTVNGFPNISTDSLLLPQASRFFQATGTDLDGGAVHYIWYVNGILAPWTTGPRWRLALAEADAPWTFTAGTGFNTNTIRLMAYNAFGDTATVTKTMSWAQCSIANGARVRMGALNVTSAPVNGARPLLLVRRWWCGATATPVDNTLFVRVVRSGTPEPWIRWNLLRTGSTIPLDSAVAPGDYHYALQYYQAGLPDTITAPDSMPASFYAGLPLTNTAPFIEELLPQSNAVGGGPFTMHTHATTTGSGTTHQWRLLARDAEGGLLTARWYVNNALVATQTVTRTANQQWSTTYTVTPSALPLPYRNSYYGVRVTVTDPAGLAVGLSVDTTWVVRARRAITLANLQITPAPDTAPGIPNGVARLAFQPHRDYTFRILGSVTNPGSAVQWQFPDGTEATVPFGTAVVRRFTRPIAPVETHGWTNTLGRLSVLVRDSSDSWDASTPAPLIDIRYASIALGTTDSVLSGNNGGVSLPARVISSPPTVAIQFPLSASGGADTSVVLGDTLRVSANVTDPDQASNYTLSWFLDDSLVSTNRSWVWPASGRTGRRFLRLRAEDASGAVGQSQRTVIVFDEALFARLSINATYVRQSETGDTTFYVAPIGTNITLDPTASVIPTGLLPTVSSRMWSGDGAPPSFTPGPPGPTIAGYPGLGGLFYPGLTLLTANGSVVRSNPIALCLLGVPGGVTIARDLPYQFLTRRVRQVELTWTSGLCAGDETRIYRQTTAMGASTLDAIVPSSQARLLRDYPMDGAPDSLYLSVRHVGGPLESGSSNTVALAWGLGATPTAPVMPPVAEAEHDGRLFAAMPMGVAVARPDSVIVFTSVTANAATTLWSVNGGAFTASPTGTITGCAPVSAVTSYTIRTMRLRVTNAGGTSERQWRVACGTAPVIGSPPVASTNVVGPLGWLRGDTLNISSTSTDPEGGLAATIWQLRESPSASEWVSLGLTDTTVTFTATGTTLRVWYFGGTTPALRLAPRSHFPQGFDIRLLVVDADGQMDTTAAIAAPYLGNQPPTVSLVRNPTGAVSTNTVVTYTAVCTDPEGDTPFTYVWSSTNRTGGGTAVSATYNMLNNGATTTQVKCTDSYGASDSVSATLSWANRVPGSGSLTVSPASPFLLGATLTLGNTGATDADGTVVQRQWEITEPDLVIRTVSAAGTTTPYTLVSGLDGTVRIRVRVQDDDGAWGNYTGYTNYIMGDPNQVPINNGIFSPAAGFSVPLGSVSTFTGACTDLDGDPLMYRWKVNGITVDSSASPSYSHTWTYGGVATITFACYDGRAWSNTVTRLGAVTTGNTPPVCTIATPAAAFSVRSSAVEDVTANGSDAEGNSFQYRWYLNGNLLATTSTGSYAYPPWGAAGATTIGVECFDASGMGALDTRSGTVTNTGPAAMLVDLPNGFSRTRNVTETLTAVARDPENHAVTAYRWYVNGTLVATTAVPTYTHTWPNALGATSVGIAAMDSYGLWGATTTLSGTLRDGHIAASLAATLVGGTQTFTATGFVGASAYAWTVNGVAAGTGPTLTRTFATAGNYSIAVTATIGGSPFTATITNYCALGTPGSYTARTYNVTQLTNGNRVWLLVGAARTLAWTAPTCRDPLVQIRIREKTGGGPWSSAWTDYGVSTGTSFTHPANLSARNTGSGSGAANKFYQFAIIYTAGGGAVSTGEVRSATWETN